MSVDKFGRYSSGQSSALTSGASPRYVNNNFLRRDGSNDVQGELNMNNHKLVGLSEPTESQDAATRGYIKNFTRNNFLKLDGTNNMAGGLDLNNNKITNVADPTEDDDAATKQYVNSRKALITIWAQENGPLNDGEFVWSFGSGDQYILKKCGYCMPAAGRILRGSISSMSDSGTARSARVEIIINGNLLSRVGGHMLTKPAEVYSHTTLTHIPLAQNDRINFKTTGNTPDAVNTIVSILIELDL